MSCWELGMVLSNKYTDVMRMLLFVVTGRRHGEKRNTIHANYNENMKASLQATMVETVITLLPPITWYNKVYRSQHYFQSTRISNNLGLIDTPRGHTRLPGSRGRTHNRRINRLRFDCGSRNRLSHRGNHYINCG